MLRRTASAQAATIFSGNLRRGDYVMRTRQQQRVGGCDARNTIVQQKQKDHGNARETNTRGI
jgi:hypothetical protein